MSGVARRAPVRVGLVGAGGFGRRLGIAAQRSADLELVGLVDPADEAARAAAAELGVPRIASVDALLDRPDVDAVIVATPHATHAPIALAALAAGRHAFVEKPLTITAADARRVIAAAADARRVLLVGHVTRLLPLVRAALERLDAGVIGQPRAAWMTRHQPLRRTGWMARSADFGMLLHSPAVHNVDLLCRILGRPVRVTALAAGPVQDTLDYPDIAALLATFAGGAIGSLGATVSDPLFGPGGTSAARIVGDRGGMAFDVATGVLEVQPADGPAERLVVEAPGWGLDEAVDAELRSFVDAIRGDAPTFVSAEDALVAVAMCEAAARSIASGGAVEVEPLLTGSGA